MNISGADLKPNGSDAEVVAAYLEKEMEEGRVVRAGTAEQAEGIGIHCSPFGVIPKRGDQVSGS